MAHVQIEVLGDTNYNQVDILFDPDLLARYGVDLDLRLSTEFVLFTNENYQVPIVSNTAMQDWPKTKGLKKPAPALTKDGLRSYRLPYKKFGVTYGFKKTEKREEVKYRHMDPNNHSVPGIVVIIPRIILRERFYSLIDPKPKLVDRADALQDHD